MKKVLLIAAILLIAVACRNSDNNEGFSTISVDDAIKALGEDENIILLDVRSLEEHNEQNIPQSILIPLDELESVVTLAITDKESRIFVYCRAGNRSRLASQILVNLGYTNVYNIAEGIIKWPEDEL